MSLTKVSYAMINGDPINVLDYGAVGDGITNDAPAFIAARTAANGKKIYVPAGTYKLNSVISSSEDLILEGDGPATILDFTGSISGGNYALEATGTATQIQNLGSTANIGTNTVVFASAPSLNIGDVFVIFNPTNSSWSGFRANYFAGEWCEVESVSGSTVTVRNSLYDTYTAASVAVYKITGPEFKLSNFAIKGTSILGLINADLCIEPLIENIKGNNENNSVISFARCFKGSINNCNVNNVGDGGDDYGIVIGNSQHIQITNGFAYARRHGVAAGGSGSVCSVPTRDMRVRGLVIKNDIASNIGSANFHGNCEDCSFEFCTIYGGVILAGQNTQCSRCTITNSGFGFVALFAEIKGGNHGLRECDLTTYINPQPNSMGILEIGGSGTAVSANTTLDTMFFAENCTIYGRNMSSFTSFALFKNKGSTVAVNFKIDGITADLDNLGQVLYTENTSGTADSNYIIVNNIANFPSNTSLHNAFGAAYRDFPHRLQKQTGSVTLTATSGQFTTIASPINFKYRYPRAPAGHATSVGTFVGNLMAFATLNDVATTYIRPQIAVGDATTAWSATADRVVYWSASIDEV